MFFVGKSEVVFLKSEAGKFENDNGQIIEWYKIVFADPETFENHELGYRPSIHHDLQKLNKGQRLKLEIELESTSKKSRAIVTNFTVI